MHGIVSSRHQSGNFCCGCDKPLGLVASGPACKTLLFSDVKTAISAYRISGNLVFVGHGLGKRCQTATRVAISGNGVQDIDRAMVFLLVEAVSILVVEKKGEVLEPEKVIEGFTNPQHARVVTMGRLVRRFQVQFIQSGTQKLNAFQDHLDDVLIAVILGAALDIVI